MPCPNSKQCAFPSLSVLSGSPASQVRWAQKRPHSSPPSVAVDLLCLCPTLVYAICMQSSTGRLVVSSRSNTCAQQVQLSASDTARSFNFTRKPVRTCPLVWDMDQSRRRQEPPPNNRVLPNFSAWECRKSGVEWSGQWRHPARPAYQAGRQELRAGLSWLLRSFGLTDCSACREALHKAHGLAD